MSRFIKIIIKRNEQTHFKMLKLITDSDLKIIFKIREIFKVNFLF